MALAAVAASGVVATLAVTMRPGAPDAVVSLLVLVPVFGALVAHFALLRPGLRASDGVAATLRAERDGARDNAARLRAEAERAEAALAEARANAKTAQKRATANSDYLATISKEVRTPLTGVIGMTELLGETRLDDEQSALVDTVRQSAAALQAVLSDVMDFAALEAGEIVLEDAPFDMREVAMKAVEEHLHAAAKKGLEVVVDIPPGFQGQCRGDALRVGRMVSALVGNAVKFTDRGEVRLSLRTRDRTGGATMVVDVSDTGIGVDPAERQRVFEPFVRGKGEASERYGGTGLGLAIAQRLARLMKGKIELQSAPGQGSRFVLSFAYRMRQTARAADIEPKLAGRRYLVIDDSSAALEVTRAALIHWGGEVVGADTVETAEDVLWNGSEDGRPFDAVLLDSSLAGDEASAFAAKVGDRADGVPVILLVPGDPRPAKAAVADGLAVAWVPKPLAGDHLERALSEAERVAGMTAEDAGRTRRPKSVQIPGLAPACIVLADDNAANRILIEKFLADEPMTLIHAPDGVGAVEAWADWAPDLILMDVSMPRMDGLAATRRIRTIERSEALMRVPIIALTARALAEDREKCLEAGMDDYVSKPIRKADLKAKITEWTQSRRKTA